MFVFYRFLSVIDISAILLLLYTACDSRSVNTMTQPTASMIVSFEELQDADGKEVTVAGTYHLHDPVPQLRRDPPFYLSAILFAGEARPRLFLEQPRPPGEQEQMKGKHVRVTGIFHIEQPKHPNDPPHAASFAGSWLYSISSIELLTK